MIQHKKNTIYYLSFPAIDSTTPAAYKTGISPVDTAYYKDGAGSWTSLAITDAAAEIGSTGVYEIDFSATEMNHDKVFVKFAVSGMADDGYMFDMTAINIDDAALASEVTAARMGALTDWIDGGRLDLILDIIAADTTTDIPALIATAQADLDTITGASGVNLLTATQASIDAIEADTNELQSDDVPGLITSLDAVVDTVKAETVLILADTADIQPNYATSAAQTTAQNDLDIITGASGVNLLTATQASIDAIEVDTGTTLPGIIDDLAVKKNATFSNFEFLMVLTSDHATPATGLTVTGQRSIDGAAFASVGGTIAEVSNGIYQFDGLAADTNGDVITWRFSSATADDTFITFKTVA